MIYQYNILIYQYKQEIQSNANAKAGEASNSGDKPLFWGREEDHDDNDDIS